MSSRKYRKKPVVNRGGYYGKVSPPEFLSKPSALPLGHSPSQHGFEKTLRHRSYGFRPSKVPCLPLWATGSSRASRASSTRASRTSSSRPTRSWATDGGDHGDGSGGTVRRDIDYRCMFCLEPPYTEYESWEVLRNHIEENHMR